MSDQWWRAGPGIAAVGFPLLVGAFSLGLYFGSTKVEACEVKYERQLNGKEGELRDCTKTNASLQAVLQLSDKDRARLLEAAAVEPPARIAFEGQPLAGKIQVPVNGNCVLEIAIWFENTGLRDIVPAGAEVILPSTFDSQDMQPVYEKGTKMTRHWIEMRETLPPGARRYAPLQFCSSEALKPGDEIPAKLTLFSSGFLPLSKEFTFILRAPKP